MAVLFRFMSRIPRPEPDQTIAYAPKHQKQGTIIGEFTRIIRLTSDTDEVLLQSQLLATELNLINYDNKFIRTTLRSKFQRTNDAIWNKISALFE